MSSKRTDGQLHLSYIDSHFTSLLEDTSTYSLSIMTTSATQPSTLSVAIASGLFGLIIGYFLGQGSSIGVFDRSRAQSHKKRAPKSWPNSYDVKVHADSSDETEGDEDDEEDDTVIVKTLNGFEDSNEEVKLMLVVRTDLGMTKGISRLSINYEIRDYSQLMGK